MSDPLMDEMFGEPDTAGNELQMKQTLTDILREIDACPSKSEARRVVHMHGVKVNGEMVKDPFTEVDVVEGTIIQPGPSRIFIRHGDVWEMQGL